MLNFHVHDTILLGGWHIHQWVDGMSQNPHQIVPDLIGVLGGKLYLPNFQIFILFFKKSTIVGLKLKEELLRKLYRKTGSICICVHIEFKSFHGGMPPMPPEPPCSVWTSKIWICLKSLEHFGQPIFVFTSYVN